jgi:hypothetical protein
LHSFDFSSSATLKLFSAPPRRAFRFMIHEDGVMPGYASVFLSVSAPPIAETQRHSSVSNSNTMFHSNPYY